MKKNIVVSICTIMLSLVASLLFSQAPETDAQILSLTKEYTLQKDGSISYHHTQKTKLLTHRSFHSLYGESYIIYNPKQQQLKINQAVTTMADGKKVASPANAFNEVLPSFASNAPDFNHLREMVITHTGLEVGATIDLEYSLTSNPGYYPFLMGREVVSEFSPVDDYRIVIKIPEGITLNYRLLNARLAPEISMSKGFQVYTFNFGKVAFAAQDPFLPAEIDYLPILSFSTANSLQQAIEAFTSQESFQQMASGSINKNFAQNIKKAQVKDASFYQKILKTQELLATEMASLSIPLSYNGFKTRTLEQSYLTNSATEIEKILLLTTGLRSLGVKAMPVALIPQKLFDAKLGNLYDFSSFMVRITPEVGDAFYVSASGTPSNDAVLGQSSKVALMLEPASESVKTFEILPVNHEISVKASLELKPDKVLQGVLSVQATNNFNPYLKVVTDSAQCKNLLSGSLSSSAISHFTVGRLTPARLDASFKIESKTPFQQEQQSYLFWEFPTATSGITSWHANVLTNQRHAPLQTPSTLKETYEYELLVPENLELINQETTLELSKVFGNVKYSIKQTGSVVKVKRSIEITERNISLLAYPEWRELLILWNNPTYSGLTFKAKQ